MGVPSDEKSDCVTWHSLLNLCDTLYRQFFFGVLENNLVGMVFKQFFAGSDEGDNERKSAVIGELVGHMFFRLMAWFNVFYPICSGGSSKQFS